MEASVLSKVPGNLKKNLMKLVQVFLAESMSNAHFHITGPTNTSSEYVFANQ